MTKTFQTLGVAGMLLVGCAGVHAVDSEATRATSNAVAASAPSSDAARAQTLAARDRMVAGRNDVRAKVEAELAKPDPDLAAVAALFEAAEEQGRALRHQTRDQWLKLYASLRADQKLVVRDELKARFDRMETMRERMKERRGPKPS